MKFNSIIRRIQNYYRIATMVNIDLNKIGYTISKILYIRFGKGSNKKDTMYRIRVPNYNHKVWNIDNITLFTLEALIFKISKHYSDKNYKSKVDELKESIEEQLYINENLVLLKPEIHRLLHSNKEHEFYKENKMYQKLLKSLSEKKIY